LNHEIPQSLRYLGGAGVVIALRSIHRIFTVVKDVERERYQCGFAFTFTSTYAIMWQRSIVQSTNPTSSYLSKIGFCHVSQQFDGIGNGGGRF
jgi:hypothetical protein